MSIISVLNFILRPVFQEILEVEQIMDEQTGLELTAENVDTVLGEIRPYLIGTGGGGLEMVDMDGPIVKVRKGALNGGIHRSPAGFGCTPSSTGRLATV